MNQNALRALAADAFHQVLDNWVFRILTALALLPILFTFTVGLRPDEIVLLFGLKSWSYAGLFSAFRVGLVPADPQGTVIRILLDVCFDFLAGSLGILLTIAATAFFVPRMLEKGAAELYFHKPVSRLTLYFSRYAAGLLFVALASGVLVLGMYLGLALVSGYHDAGILVAALQITYVFALVHSFSMLVGVVTRSTVAAILLTSFFFLFNGCIQQSWVAMQQSEQRPKLDLEQDDERSGTDKEGPGRADEDAGATAGDDEPAEGSPMFGFVRPTLNALHLVLPKTTDADFFARKLRRAIGRPAFRDADSLVYLPSIPAGLTRLEEPALAGLATGVLTREALGEPRLALVSDQPRATLSLWRRPCETSETRIGERVRKRVETTSQAGAVLEKQLKSSGVAEAARETKHFGSIPGGRDLLGQALSWSEGGLARKALVFRGAQGDWVYTLLVAPEAETTPEELEALTARLADHMGMDLGSIEDWYPSRLAFDAPLPFNILFSVCSSLAFAAAMFLLGVWRLQRIAF